MEVGIICTPLVFLSCLLGSFGRVVGFISSGRRVHSGALCGSLVSFGFVGAPFGSSGSFGVVEIIRKRVGCRCVHSSTHLGS